MSTKRIIVIMLVLALIGSFTIGCGGSGGSDGGGAGDSGDVGANDGKTITIKYGNSDTESRSNNVTAKKFKEFMEANTDGQVIVEIYPNEQLGDDAEMVKGLQLGTVQIYTGAPGGSFGGVFGEKLDLLDLPFLYSDYDNWYEGVFEKGGGDEYAKLLSDNGLYNLTYLYDGARCMSSNVRPIYSVDDLKGVKMRCMSSKIYVAMFDAMGANPTPMSWGEVYTGLAQGTIEGQDNGPAITCDKRIYEVTKYYSLTRHTMPPAPVTTSQAFMDSLPDDIASIFLEGIDILGKEQRALEFELENGYIQEIEDGGCAVNEITDIDSFREAVKPVYDEWRDIVGDDVIDAMLASAGR
jgi:tripartite ATP-independent transporter DctP family solute receptor